MTQVIPGVQFLRMHVGDAVITFLFTDIEGSTRIWEAEPEAMQAAHEKHLELIAAAVAKHGGRLVKSRGEGDSTFSVFNHPVHAVAAAIDTQRRLQAMRWPTSLPLRVRIALHTGTAFAKEGDFHSGDVNRCARLRAITHGGQIVASQRTRELALSDTERPLAPDMFRDLGLHRLRDLQEPENVYQVVADGLRRDFPPLDSLESHPNNLPRSLTSFVGREKELKEINDLLGHNSLVTLTGMGGTGKTRLALQAASALTESFRHGIWFVELASLTSPDQTARTVAASLGLREDPGRPVKEALLHYLADRELLLLLDNCEHLVRECAHLAVDILQVCSRVKVLATSREPLAVAGEVVYRVPSLHVPMLEELCPGNPRIAPAEVVQIAVESDAISLFVERARMQQPGFSITPENTCAVIQLCRSLDGIPLAVELAAARMRSMTVDQIVARIDRRFQLLASGDRAALERHQTLRALVDWSHDLLKPEEQLILQRLSVFAGEFGLDDAEFVLSDEGNDQTAGAVEAWQILDILTSLVDKSLLNFIYSENGGGTAGRYRLLETIRQYGQEKLAERGSARAVRERHCLYFLQKVEENQAVMLANGGRGLETIRAIQDDVRTAQDFCSAESRPENTDRELRFCAVMWFFYVYSAFYREGDKRLTHAIAQTDAPNFSVPYAKSLVGAAALAYYLCENEKCVHLCYQALPICLENNLPFHAALCEVVLGTYAFVTGDIAEAERVWRSSYALAEQAGDFWVRSLVASWLGDIAMMHGDETCALQSAAEGLAFARQSGEAYVTFHALFHLGLIQNQVGDTDRAQQSLIEALQLCRSSGHSVGVSSCIEGLAATEARNGNAAHAARLLGSAVSLRRTYSLELPAAFDLIRGRIMETVKRSMTPDDFEQEFRTGENWSPEEIIANVLAIKSPAGAQS